MLMAKELARSLQRRTAFEVSAHYPALAKMRRANHIHNRR